MSGFHIVYIWLVPLTLFFIIIISLVNENHVDNNFKEILMFVYYGSTQKLHSAGMFLTKTKEINKN